MSTEAQIKQASCESCGDPYPDDDMVVIKLAGVEGELTLCDKCSLLDINNDYVDALHALASDTYGDIISNEDYLNKYAIYCLNNDDDETLKVEALLDLFPEVKLVEDLSYGDEINAVLEMSNGMMEVFKDGYPEYTIDKL